MSEYTATSPAALPGDINVTVQVDAYLERKTGWGIDTVWVTQGQLPEWAVDEDSLVQANSQYVARMERYLRITRYNHGRRKWVVLQWEVWPWEVEKGYQPEPPMLVLGFSPYLE